MTRSGGPSRETILEHAEKVYHARRPIREMRKRPNIDPRQYMALTLRIHAQLHLQYGPKLLQKLIELQPYVEEKQQYK